MVLVLALAVTLFIFRLVALRQLRSKYALLWLVVAVLILPLAAVPSLLDDVAHWLGFSYAPALLFLAAIGFLFAVVVHLSWELSRLELRVRTLAEEQALMRPSLDRSADESHARRDGPRGLPEKGAG